MHRLEQRNSEPLLTLQQSFMFTTWTVGSNPSASSLPPFYGHFSVSWFPYFLAPLVLEENFSEYVT